MFASSGRRAIRFFLTVNDRRLKAYVNFAIFSCFAALISLTVAYSLEFQSAKYRIEMSQNEALSEYYFNLYSQRLEHFERLRLISSTLSHNLTSARSGKDKSCTLLSSDLGNRLILSAQASLLFVETENKRQDDINKYFEMKEVFWGAGFADSPNGIDIERTLNTWDTSELIYKRVNETVDKKQESQRMMIEKNELAAEIVIWLFLLQIFGYLIVNIADARNIGVKK